MRKKVISPEQRRRAARAVVASELCSGRAACRFLKVSRSTYWYRSKEPTSQEQRLLKRLMELSEKHARYGYRRIAALLRQEGWPVGKRHVQRLRRSLGLRVPPTKRKVVRRGLSTGLPTKAEHRGHVWSWDFISDATTRGGALRMLTILDEYTRECHVLRADRALKSSDVLEWIGRAIAEHGSPTYLRSDNGPEFKVREDPPLPHSFWAGLLNDSRIANDYKHPNGYENKGRNDHMLVCCVCYRCRNNI